MNLRRGIILFTFLTFLASPVLALPLVVVSSNFSPHNSNYGLVQNYWGEAFVTNAGVGFNNLRFNFFSDLADSNPTAVGTGFLLTQEFLGNPSALSNSTPGYVASAASNSAQQYYVFNPSFTIAANTQYYFYSNATFIDSGGDGNAQFYDYFSNAGNLPFNSDAGPPAFSNDFMLTSGIPAPEIDLNSSGTPICFLFFLLGLCGSRKLNNQVDA
jgi:hypothetical protein